MATAVEMLYVPDESPPVPQQSTALYGASMPITFSRMTVAAPVISSTVSPLSFMAVRNGAIAESEASPFMMVVMATRMASSVMGVVVSGSMALCFTIYR